MRYAVHRGIVPAAYLKSIAGTLLDIHRNRNDVLPRAGFGLEYNDWVLQKLWPVLYHAMKRTGVPMKFMPSWSACQLVNPKSDLVFRPHQDTAALGVKSPGQPGITAWIPMQDIAPEMPTLAVVKNDVDMLAHVDDGQGRSVLPSESVRPGWTWVVMDDLVLGDVVLMDALCVHRTHMPAVCTRSRMSLDIRMVAQ